QSLRAVDEGGVEERLVPSCEPLHGIPIHEFADHDAHGHDTSHECTSHFCACDRSGSTPRPAARGRGRRASWILGKGSARASRNGLGLLSTSSSPSPPMAASTCAEASKPIPPPRKWGQ